MSYKSLGYGDPIYISNARTADEAIAKARERSAGLAIHHVKKASYRGGYYVYPKVDERGNSQKDN